MCSRPMLRIRAWRVRSGGRRRRHNRGTSNPTLILALALTLALVLTLTLTLAPNLNLNLTLALTLTLTRHEQLNRPSYWLERSKLPESLPLELGVEAVRALLNTPGEAAAELSRLPVLRLL